MELAAQPTSQKAVQCQQCETNVERSFSRYTDTVICVTVVASMGWRP